MDPRSPERRPGRPLLFLAALFACGPLLGQTGEMQALAEAYRRNHEELMHYAWTQRTEVRVDGALKETILARLHHAPDGEIERVEDGRKEKGGRKTDGLSRELRNLIRAYTRFTPGQMRGAFARASIFPGEGERAGLVRVEARSVVRQGDSLLFWADTVTRRPRRFEILTSLDGDPVKVTTELADLLDGPTHPVRTVIETETKGRRVRLEIESSDYAREDGGG